MRSQRGDDLVEAIAGGVVEQDAHAHATVGSLEQFLHQHPRADAVMDDVVLQVEAALGVADQLGAGGEGFGAVGQQAKAGTALMGRGLGLDRATEAESAAGKAWLGSRGTSRVAQPLAKEQGEHATASSFCPGIARGVLGWRQGGDGWHGTLRISKTGAGRILATLCKQLVVREVGMSSLVQRLDYESG